MSAVTGKKGRGRPRSNQSLKNLPVKEKTFDQWRGLRSELGFHTDNDLAVALLSTYIDRVERDFTEQVNERVYGVPANASTPFRRQRKKIQGNKETILSPIPERHEAIYQAEIESLQPNECSDQSISEINVSGINAISADPPMEVQEKVNDNEWYSDSEDSEDDVDFLNAEFEDLKLGDDFFISHDIQEGIDTADERETLNSSTFKTIPEIDRTVLSEVSMEWHSLEDKSMSLGYGRNNPVQLEDDYYKNFAKEDDIKFELNEVKDEKFMCSLSCIQELCKMMSPCTECKQPRKLSRHSFSGVVLVLEIECENKHKVKWSSSKMVNNMYSLNLQLSAAIALSGNLFAKISRLSDILGLKIPSESSFYRVLRLYVTPSVTWWWEQMQEMLFEKFRGKQLYLAGDGRNDSPGHCSTYCNYTLMDTVSNLIIHQEIVDVRQAEMKSPNMEKIGCKKGLEFLKEKKLKIAGFVTDDHNQISAMMSNEPEYQNVEYQKDCWHKSAKITKKFAAAGKEKGNSKILDWVPSIRNHFWHCSESCDGKLDDMKDRWINMLKHMCNLHHACSHGPLEHLERSDWFDPTDSDFGVAREMVLDKKLLKSFRYYTKFKHTGMLEVFHNQLLMYIPKRIFFKYPSYSARSKMAIIDYNHHCQRPQRRDQFGNPMWSKRWSKKAGRWIPMLIKEPKKYEYMGNLMAIILKARSDDGKSVKRIVGLAADDPRRGRPTIAKLPTKQTKDLVSEKLSRFTK
eukprot:Seg1221.6 transcript_id=Seg1221.6/GoldUCD/mRNA.D3Y31 product="hypothetical protein" protein_id=Seg1221.6/GoldUCD/D3Y31